MPKGITKGNDTLVKMELNYTNTIFKSTSIQGDSRKHNGHFLLKETNIDQAYEMGEFLNHMPIQNSKLSSKGNNSKRESQTSPTKSSLVYEGITEGNDTLDKMELEETDTVCKSTSIQEDPSKHYNLVSTLEILTFDQIKLVFKTKNNSSWKRRARESPTIKQS